MFLLECIALQAAAASDRGKKARSSKPTNMRCSNARTAGSGRLSTAQVLVLACTYINFVLAQFSSPVPMLGRSPLTVLRVGTPDSADAGDSSLARPLFLDTIDVLTGAILATTVIPTERRAENGAQHWRCAQSFARATPLHASLDSRFFTLGCYDASAFADRLPAFAGLAADAGNSRRVVARISATGHADTRTVIAADDRCSEARISSAVSSDGEYFVVATVPLLGAANTSRCPLSVVPYGNQGNGSWPPVPRLWNVSMAHVIFRNLLAMDMGPGGSIGAYIEIGRFDGSTPPPGANTTNRTISTGYPAAILQRRLPLCMTVSASTSPAAASWPTTE